MLDLKKGGRVGGWFFLLSRKFRVEGIQRRMDPGTSEYRFCFHFGFFFFFFVLSYSSGTARQVSQLRSRGLCCSEALSRDLRWRISQRLLSVYLPAARFAVDVLLRRAAQHGLWLVPYNGCCAARATDDGRSGRRAHPPAAHRLCRWVRGVDARRKLVCLALLIMCLQVGLCKSYGVMMPQGCSPYLQEDLLAIALCQVGRRVQHATIPIHMFQLPR